MWYLHFTEPIDLRPIEQTCFFIHVYTIQCISSFCLFFHWSCHLHSKHAITLWYTPCKPLQEIFSNQLHDNRAVTLWYTSFRLLQQIMLSLSTNFLNFPHLLLVITNSSYLMHQRSIFKYIKNF